MKLAIMQPYFFPYLGYFQLIKSVDKMILYENVAFMKKTWMTRNQILIKNGDPIFIQVPVATKSSSKTIGQIQISNQTLWKNTLKRMVYFNYCKSPHFKESFPLIEQIIDYDTSSLHAYNCNLIQQISQWLDCGTEFQSDNKEYLPIEEELEEQYAARSLLDGLDMRKTDRLIRIIKSEEASTYINPIGGISLYDKDVFQCANIQLFFIETQKHTYPQFSDTFHPNLSIIDVLLNCGVEQTKELLTGYSLV